MSNIIDTFSANSLKLLNEDIDEFKNRYIYQLSLYKKDERTVLGQKFHSLICAYLSGFNIEKMLLALDEKELIFWKKLEEYLSSKKSNFIKLEYSFLTKDFLKDKPYYLTGRFDAICKEKENYIIYDWKTLNLPRNPQNDLQTIVYLYCASKIFKSENVKIRYLSIEKLESIDINFSDKNAYKSAIEDIILKIY